MKSAKTVFFFGWFKRYEHLLMQRFRYILSIEPDKDHEGRNRVLPEDAQRILVEVKQEVLSMIERYFDIEDNTYLCEEIVKLSKAPTEEKVKLQMQQALLAEYRPVRITLQHSIYYATHLFRSWH